MRVENMINSRLSFLQKFIIIGFAKRRKIRSLYDVMVDNLSYEENVKMLNIFYGEKRAK